MKADLRLALLQQTERATGHEQSLSMQLAIPLLAPGQLMQDSIDYVLELTETGLQIKGLAKLSPCALCVDFDDSNLQRRSRESLKSQSLGKAVGLNRHPRMTVLDATAGLGTDAYLLAVAGCSVTLLERSLLVHAMLSDGMRRARTAATPAAQAMERMDIHHQDFLEYPANNDSFDVVYLDPMFPDTKRSARARKPMFILQELVPPATDEVAMLERALNLASKRVVVKRARLSPLIGDRPPDIQFKGASSRFDVYLIHR